MSMNAAGTTGAILGVVLGLALLVWSHSKVEVKSDRVSLSKWDLAIAVADRDGVLMNRYSDSLHHYIKLAELTRNRDSLIYYRGQMQAYVNAESVIIWSK